MLSMQELQNRYENQELYKALDALELKLEELKSMPAQERIEILRNFFMRG